MGRTPRLHSEKVDAILEAARDCFALQGFEHTPVARIADKANVAGGTIIYHFRSKDNLLFILTRQILYNLFSALRQAVQRMANPWDSVDSFVMEYQRFVEERSMEYLVLINADPFRILDVTQPAYLDLKIFQSWMIHLLAEVLQRGVDARLFALDSVSQPAQIIVSMLHSAARSRLLSSGQTADLFPEVLQFVHSRLAYVPDVQVQMA